MQQELSHFPIWVCLELTGLMPYSHQARLVMTFGTFEALILGDAVAHFVACFIWGLNFVLLFISRVLSWLLERLSPLFWLIKMDSSA